MTEHLFFDLYLKKINKNFSLLIASSINTQYIFKSIKSCIENAYLNFY